MIAFFSVLGFEVSVELDHSTSGTFFDYRRDGSARFFWAGTLHVVVDRKRVPSFA